jgi:ABC-type sugar transport system substrate-binding protein
MVLLFALSGTVSAADDQIVVGYVCKDINDTFMNYLIEEAQKYADEFGITLQVVDAQNDVVKQQDQVEAFITQKVDAVIVLPIDSSACEPMTEAAVKANIPLVYVNTSPYPDGNFPEGTYYVGSVEKEAGEMQAEYIASKIKDDGKIVILQGSLGHEGALKRTDGVIEKMAELKPNVVVLDKLPGNWQKDQGMTLVENWLTKYNNDIDAVFANNDEMALGAINALSDIGKTDCLVAGIDGTKDGIAAVKAGTMTCSVLQDAHGQGYGAMEIVHKIVKGEEVEQVTWVPFKLINIDNVSDFE